MLVYLVLGAAGSGRRGILADLIEGGLDPGDRPAVLLSDAEGADAADARLPGLGRWSLSGDGSVVAELPRGANPVFLVADGRRNPVDQVEAFSAWMAGRPAEVARVLCVVDCRLAEANPPLFAWYEACVHFSDVVLLNHREGVSNRWMADFQRAFAHRFYPCLFEIVKGGRVRNPAFILIPEARRISHVFDEPEWLAADEEGEEEDGEIEVEPESDPYLERRLGGRRVKEIPDIREFLPGRRG